LVSVRRAPSAAVVELSAAAAPRRLAALARALLAPHGAHVEEDHDGARGWALRVALPARAAEAVAPA
jgi:hypothetical protein